MAGRAARAGAGRRLGLVAAVAALLAAGPAAAQQDSRPGLPPLPRFDVAPRRVPLPFEKEPERRPSGSEVVLRGLDKVTARITTFPVPIGGTAAFGALHITARYCNKRPPEETPEVSAFLEIDEIEIGGSERRPVFSGWMFASSPALSALEHAVYDVWVLDCRMASTD